MRHSRPAAIVLLALFAAAAIAAQAPADSSVYAVAYVDVMPSGRPAAIAALIAYRGASARDGGYVQVDLFEQIGRPAHFAVVEVWRDQAAFDEHANGAATRQFHLTMAPIRVSGYDQRPYKALSIGTARTAAGSAVHVVSHVDIGGGGGLAGAPAMLGQLADASRKEQGNLRFDVLQHATRGNHFTVVESWTSQGTLDAHAAAAHTRQYRDALQPISGSPLDERTYAAIE